MSLESRLGLTLKRESGSFFTEGVAPSSSAAIMPCVLAAWTCSVRMEMRSFVVLYISKDLIQTKEDGNLGLIYLGTLIQAC